MDLYRLSNRMTSQSTTVWFYPPGAVRVLYLCYLWVTGCVPSGDSSVLLGDLLSWTTVCSQEKTIWMSRRVSRTWKMTLIFKLSAVLSLTGSSSTVWVKHVDLINHSVLFYFLRHKTLNFRITFFITQYCESARSTVSQRITTVCTVGWEVFGPRVFMFVTPQCFRSLNECKL